MSKSTRMRVQILVTAWVALTVAILSTACTPSKGGAPRPAAPKPAATATPAPYNYSASNDLDGQSGSSQQETPTRDGQTQDDRTVDPGVVHYDPTGLTPEQVFDQPRVGSTEGSVSDVADDSGQQLNYSGAAQDDLATQIAALVPNTRGNVEFASELSRGMFFLDSSRAATVVVLHSLPSGERYRVTLKGVLDRARRVRFAPVGPGISGAAECLDLNGGCDNVHVKLVDESVSPAREAHMIIRSTNATLYTEGNGFGIAHNSEYDHLLNILVNTATHRVDVGYVNRLVLQTSETINGSASVAVEMDFLANFGRESVYFNGPLVRAPGSDNLNVEMAQTAANGSRAGLISDTISGIRLVRNDGHGNIQVAMTVRAVQPGSSEDTVTLTLARIQKPVKRATSL